MKKKTFFAALAGLCITITSVIFLSSFSNQSANIKKEFNNLTLKLTNTTEYNVTVQNGMLFFANVSDYLGILSEGDAVQANFKTFVNGLSGFTSLLNGNTSELKTAFGDDYISNIVNSNGCVRIGGSIYKISNNHNSVLVLSNSNINTSNLADLYSETSNSNILVYSTADDVIDLVENGIPPSGAAERCNEDGAGERRQTGAIDWIDTGSGSLDAEIYHLRGGIYFSLRAIVSAISFGTSQRRIEMHRDPIHFKRRCGSWTGPISDWNTTIIPVVSNAGSNFSQYGYVGSSPLSKYKYRYVFMAKYIPNPTGVPDPSTDLIIRVNL